MGRNRTLRLDDEGLARFLVTIANKFGVDLRCSVSTDDTDTQKDVRTLFINRFVAVTQCDRRGTGAMHAIIRFCRQAKVHRIGLIAYPLIEINGHEDECEKVTGLVHWYEMFGFKLTEPELHPHQGNEMILILSSEQDPI